MQETAIPIDHAQLAGIYEDIAQKPEYSADKAIASMANDPGWKEIEALINAEIDRLNEPEWQGETVEEYGFKCLASSLAKSKLAWVVRVVNETERAVRESK